MTRNRTTASERLLVRLCDGLARRVDRLRFDGAVAYVYNPLVYAGENYRAYLRRYARRSCRVVLLGMNPGPWGMAQTGVPFGEVAAVRDFLRIRGRVGRPGREHPKRPVLGLDCPRSEVSGRRLWGWVRAHFGSPEAFFERFFVANYCPLAFLEASGRNRTPDRLPAEARGRLFEICDDALRLLVDWLEPEWVIGVGGFAEQRARAALKNARVRIGRILHPSPASPAANRGWDPIATRQLAELGIAVR